MSIGPGVSLARWARILCLPTLMISHSTQQAREVRPVRVSAGVSAKERDLGLERGLVLPAGPQPLRRLSPSPCCHPASYLQSLQMDPPRPFHPRLLPLQDQSSYPLNHVQKLSAVF